MDVAQENNCTDVHEVALSEQFLSQESAGLGDDSRDPELLPQVGDEYQVEIPPLIAESERGLYEKLFSPESVDVCDDFGGEGGTWSDIEEASFLLGLYIFGKDLVAVKKFAGTKGMGEILSFYYGDKFYRSDKYLRWSGFRKMRSEPGCIYGQRIFTGLRQQELLTRLVLLHESEECKSTLLEDTKAFEEGKMSLEEYVFTLRAKVGLNALVEAVGIGKGKQDLTYMAVEPLRSNEFVDVHPEMPIGNACSMLTSLEIINLLTGGYRLSKNRVSDLFWKAVWPRLFARGWHTEQLPNNQGSAAHSKYSLIYIVPGVEKIPRSERVKGKHYFETVNDVLSKVTSDPGLLDQLEMNPFRKRMVQTGRLDISAADPVAKRRKVEVSSSRVPMGAPLPPKNDNRQVFVRQTEEDKGKQKVEGYSSILKDMVGEELATKERQLKEKDKQLKGKDLELNKLKDKQEGYNSLLKDMEGKLATKEQQLKEKDKQLKGKDLELNKLKDKLEGYSSLLKDKEGELATKEQQLKEKNKRLRKKTMELNKLEDQLKHKAEANNEQKVDCESQKELLKHWKEYDSLQKQLTLWDINITVAAGLKRQTKALTYRRGFNAGLKYAKGEPLDDYTPDEYYQAIEYENDMEVELAAKVQQLKGKRKHVKMLHTGLEKLKDQLKHGTKEKNQEKELVNQWKKKLNCLQRQLKAMWILNNVVAAGTNRQNKAQMYRGGFNAGLKYANGEPMDDYTPDEYYRAIGYEAGWSLKALAKIEAKKGTSKQYHIVL